MDIYNGFVFNVAEYVGDDWIYTYLRVTFEIDVKKPTDVKGYIQSSDITLDHEKYLNVQVDINAVTLTKSMKPDEPLSTCFAKGKIFTSLYIPARILQQMEQLIVLHRIF